MKKWKIVADSSTDIRHFNDLPEHIQYSYVPFILNIDGQTYLDDESHSTQEIIDIYSQAKQAPSSACPSPESFAKEFTGAENIVCITISSNVSGSYNSAVLGKAMVLETYPQLPIYIHDSKSSSTEVNLLVRKAVELAKANVTLEEMEKGLKAYHDTISVNFLLENVDNLVKNGRVNRFVGTVIGILGIRLIGKRTSDGRIELAHKAKGIKRAYQTMIKEMESQGFKGGHIEVSHANNLEGAHGLIKAIQDRYPDITYEIIMESNLNSFYAERNGLIISYSIK